MVPASSSRPRRSAAVVLAIVCALLACAAVPAGSQTRARATRSVIVRLAPDADAGAVIEGLGGRVRRSLGIISGVLAEVPGEALPRLTRAPGVLQITPDSPLQLTAASPAAGPEAAAAEDLGSMAEVVRLIEAHHLWQRGFTGEGVGVALIDSGVVPVEGLRHDVRHGPDLSFEGTNGALRTLDTYGHGTHMAGIIAGRDANWSAASADAFAGVAPGAHLVSVKVADATGATDVSQVIAAIDWVVQHRRELDIRVLNLSFGTDGLQPYSLDPLAFAVERAWQEGIVVVVAAGNGGLDDGRLNNPAYDPFVIAVGAVDPHGTKPTHDDEIPEWSSRGDGDRNPDLVAPGRSIVSLRNPGSAIDRAHPGARVGDRFFRGSGTSHAAAVVSGAVALLLDQRPGLSPDEVKQLLRASAVELPAADRRGQGEGMLNVKGASQESPRFARQRHARSLGLGLLEEARGTLHLSDGVNTLIGEIDASGQVWNALEWTLAATAETSWSAGSWTGASWGGGTWMGNKWADGAWTGNKWAERSWTGRWTGNKWADQSWPPDEGTDRQWSTPDWG